MNGYYQIPIKKLKVVKGKVILSINSKSYTYNPKGKFLLKIIKDAGYDLSQIHIGFMVKDGKVVSNDALEIIKKRISERAPKSHLVQSESKKEKLKNKKASSKKDVKEKKKKRKGKRAVQDARKTTRKLTHRFRSIQLPISKLEFQKDRIRLQYGIYKFTDKASGSTPKFNTLKKRKEITLDKIPLKLNNEIAIIDVETKQKLLDQFHLAKINFDEEQIQIKQVNNEKAKNKSPKKKQQEKKVNKIKSTRISENDSSNWNQIRFYNKKITYSGKWFNAPKSQTYLNHLKPFFNRKSFSYRIFKENNKVSNVIISEEVYQLVKLGKQVEDILNINSSKKISSYTFQINKFGLEYYDLLSILGKSKTIYLEYLFKNQIENNEIICIPEPIFQNGELVKKDISFIFLLGNINNPLIVWESVEPNKASYLFDIDIDRYPFERVLNTIQTFLLLEEPYKRSILRRSNYDLIEGVKGIQSLRHEYYYEKDITWTNNIEYKLRKRR